MIALNLGGGASYAPRRQSGFEKLHLRKVMPHPHLAVGGKSGCRVLKPQAALQGVLQRRRRERLARRQRRFDGTEIRQPLPQMGLASLSMGHASATGWLIGRAISSGARSKLSKVRKGESEKSPSFKQMDRNVGSVAKIRRNVRGSDCTVHRPS
jgi:hypothetical protein